MTKYIVYEERIDYDLSFKKSRKGFDSKEKAYAYALMENEKQAEFLSVTGDSCDYPIYEPEWDGSYEEYLEENKEEIEKCENCPYRELVGNTCKNSHWSSEFGTYKVEEVEWDNESEEN